ncbi:hypothetical protein R1A27_20140 [Methylobacterium sp. NMS12]|uniref:hypothetical protein n=1 Tax=Methylobacterium sp. NMS12 TaxID=3079766 RepID=UPI003F88531E
MSNSIDPTADLPPEVQTALDRLAHYYDGSKPWDPNTNPGGMRNGGHRRNFVPALVDAATAIVAIVGLMTNAIAIGNNVIATAAIAQPLLDQAVVRLNDALQAVEDAEAARDRAEAASGVVTGDLRAKFEGLLPGLETEAPPQVGKMWLSGNPDGGSYQVMITTKGVPQGVTPTPQAPIVHMVTSDEFDAHKQLTRALSFAFH